MQEAKFVSLKRARGKERTLRQLMPWDLSRMLTPPHTGKALEKPCHQAGQLPTLSSAFLIRQGVPSHVAPGCAPLPTSGWRSWDSGCTSLSDEDPHDGQKGGPTARLNQLSEGSLVFFFFHIRLSAHRNNKRAKHGYPCL